MTIAQNDAALHCVRVRTPEGADYEVDPHGPCGLRRAVRIATALAGWLPVDDWECASRHRPTGVEEVRRDILEDFPDADFSNCTVVVLCPCEEGPDAPNGYEVVATFLPGTVEPEVVRSIRAEAEEAGWREEPGRRPAIPYLRVARFVGVGRRAPR